MKKLIKNKVQTHYRILDGSRHHLLELHDSDGRFCVLSRYDIKFLIKDLNKLKL